MAWYRLRYRAVRVPGRYVLIMSARILALAAAAAKRLRGADRATYVLYASEQGRAWVGTGRPRLRLEGGELRLADSAPRSGGVDAFFTELAHGASPLFFLIGPPSGPAGSSGASAVAIAPDTEFEITPEAVECSIGDGGELLAELRRETGSGSERTPESILPEFAAGNPMQDWAGDSDEQYRTRLARAIELTRGRSGKIIVTRRYERKAPALSALDLFYELGTLEPSAAAVHYAELPGEWSSLGTSPENVIESRAGQLLVDAVAGTRARHGEPGRDAALRSELCADAKERREHAMAVERAEHFATGVCAPGSVRIAFSREVRRLRAVQHLHSRIEGTLEPGVQFAMLMQRCHPPLSSYPPALAEQVDPPWPGRFYGGMLGRIAGPQQGMSFLNLRCLELEKGSVFAYAGVGVVDGSNVEGELREVLAKLATVRDAVDRWLR